MNADYFDAQLFLEFPDFAGTSVDRSIRWPTTYTESLQCSGVNRDYWDGRDVFVTGHTGFKGAWLCVLLNRLGARICGYALDTPSTYLFNRAGLQSTLSSDGRGDIRDCTALSASLVRSGAAVVLHLAAQSVVRESYKAPRETFSVNVDGTISVLEAVMNSDSVERCVVVTTDKVYRNNEWPWGYREIDPLGGDDPYSASKAAAEIAAHAYATSLRRDNLAIATARAGNVIGGGDATPDALMPELIDACRTGRQAVIRNPEAVRPWQHALEPLTGYLTLAESLGPQQHDTAWNFGPAAEGWLTVAQVADRVAELWGGDAGWERAPERGPHESGVLTLDSAKARAELGWTPTLDVQRSIEMTVEWEKAVGEGEHVRTVTERQVDEYLRLQSE